MSDSFADLWNSSAPTKPVPQPQKLGSLSTKNAVKSAQPDAFSLLSSVGSSNPSSRSMSPVVTGGTSQRTTSNSTTKSLSNGNSDAFSSLLNGSLAASTNDNTRMTMAERAAEAERQKLENLRRHEETIKTPTLNVWDGLDSLAMSSTQPVPLSSFKSREVLLDDDWGLDASTSQPASQADIPPASAATTEGNGWPDQTANKSVEHKSVSPPPHILGQIVEMGFSVQQARIALAATDSGLDVPAALETLLANGSAFDAPHPRPSPQLREQADKLLTHASEIGLNMFSKATSLWKEGKERVQKVYVERATVAGTSNGRPRWMTEQASHQLRQERATEPKTEPTVADLFSENPQPIAYISPFRRRTPASTGAVASLAESTSCSTPPARSVECPSSPVRQRANLVSASQSALAAAHQHKETGSAKFKLGQYAEADAAYSLGISALPPGHLLLVPLHNNRALARLRTGDHTGAIHDAGAVLDLIGVGYHPQREAKVEKEEAGAGVDLGGALVKALKRRAEAWEGREKWEEAAADWGVLAGLEWVGQKARSEAVRAAGRCRKMLVQNKQADAGDRAPKSVASTPKHRPHVTSASSSQSGVLSQALENLRTVNDAAEAEDQLRHELKDSVDAKLVAWKGGKEINIRALLGSLDIVLWPELGLQKVGMAELVTPAQVKNKYTRTIAKLHPDKLNSSNPTVEQRMIANGVFGALNEAWNAFKQ